ncbi:MAG: MFS transporter [Burkholderiales bacterium]|nr:MFS transporter [Burkholderiales bacterium]
MKSNIMLNNKQYETFVIFMAALINSIAGIVVDLYAPCLPAIEHDLQVSSVIMQNTISLSIIGYACGQIFFGILCDWKGRKFTISLGLIVFILASIGAALAKSIILLIFARILQGFAAGSCQVVARAILIDEVKGPRFAIGVVYLSTAFALGLILSPYVGAEIQQFLGWRWDFGFYALYSTILLGILVWRMKESLPAKFAQHPKNTLNSYKHILSNRVFIAFSLQLGCCFMAFTLWNQIGPFIVQHTLNKSATYFGLIALCTGSFYLVGTLLNRLLIKHLPVTRRIKLSLSTFLLGIVVLMIDGSSFHLLFLLPGLMIITLAQGMIFPNILSQAMSLFPDKAGLSASLQGAGMLIFGFLGLSLVSFIQIKSSLEMSGIYATLFIIFFMVNIYVSHLTTKTIAK